jgi:hypothetical protein
MIIKTKIFSIGDSVCEVGDANSPAPPSTPAPTTPGPRQSGSLVTHHDDVVTRMKNIQMIELGRHRIKPWYFAPYPQVCHHLTNVKIRNVYYYFSKIRKWFTKLVFTYASFVSSTGKVKNV